MRALLYLQYQTFINRQASRLKRLKRPKYLIGGIAGALYFYFYFFRLLFGGGRRGTSTFDFSSEHLQFVQTIAASVLLVIVVLAWLIPHGRAALMFTEAEVNFLFPAPISRRTLIHFKLVKSQIAILFTTLLLTLVTGRFGGAGSGWIRALGWWVILSTLNLHFLGSSFARTMLLERGISNWKRRLIVLLVLAALVAIVVIWSRRAGGSLSFPDLQDFPALKDYFRQLTTTGPAPYLLYPFRMVVQPFFAQRASQFLLLLAPALAIMLFHYLWVIRANVAFEEASVDLSRRIAERMTAARSGNLQPRPTKAKASPFRLAPIGSPAVALFWKNLIAAGQMFSLRIWLILLCSLMPMMFLTQLPDMGKVPFGSRFSVALGIAVVIPMLNLILLIIPNASVLLFPGWFQSGREGPHGIEATGQRLIFMLGQVLVFVVALIPAGAGAFLVYLPFVYWKQYMLGIPVASVAFAVVLAIEAAIAVFALGRIFERFDLSAET